MPIFPFHLGLQEIVDGFGRLRAADLFGVVKINHERRPDAVEISVFVVKAGAQAAPLGRSRSGTMALAFLSV